MSATTVELQPVRSPGLTDTAHARPSRGLLATAWSRLMHDRLTLIAAGMLLVYAVLAIGAEFISVQVFNTNPTRIDMLNTLKPPAPGHWLGTDEFGRDQLVRALFGARVSLIIGFAAAAITLSVGIALGAIGGFYGGRVDDLVVWLISTLRAIPGIFLLILVGALFRPSVELLALVIGLISWPGVARVMRGQVIAARERDYVLAARASGASNARLIARHLVPNVLPIALVILGQDIGAVILTESALSYLGLGVQPPQASWGNMLSNAQRYVSSGVWLVIAPGLFIFTTVLALYLVADGLRDALDPRLRR